MEVPKTIEEFEKMLLDVGDIVHLQTEDNRKVLRRVSGFGFARAKRRDGSVHHIGGFGQTKIGLLGCLSDKYLAGTSNQVSEILDISVYLCAPMTELGVANSTSHSIKDIAQATTKEIYDYFEALFHDLGQLQSEVKKMYDAFGSLLQDLDQLQNKYKE